MESIACNAIQFKENIHNSFNPYIMVCCTLDFYFHTFSIMEKRREINCVVE